MANLELVDVVDAMQAFREIVDEWRLSGEPSTYFQGQIAQQMSAEVSQAADELFERLANRDVSGYRAKQLVIAIDAFEDAFVSWLDDINNQMQVHPGGSSAMWNLFDQSLTLLDHPPGEKKPESIEQLLREKVPYQQIAKIWGLVLPDGSGDVARLNEEIANPGTHIKSDWMSSDEQARRRDIDRRWQSRVEELDRAEAKQAAQTAGMGDDCPESLEDLIQQRVPIAQIARMKEMSEDEVRHKCVEMEVAIDSSVIGYADTSYTPADDEQQEKTEETRLDDALRAAKVNNYPELSKEERIVKLSKDGNRPSEIAKLLETAYPGITYQQVNTILRKAKAEQTSEEKTAETTS